MKIDFLNFCNKTYIYDKDLTNKKMKMKNITIFIILLLMISIVSIGIIAKSGSSDDSLGNSNSTSESGSDSGNDNEKEETRKTIIDEHGREVEVRTKTKVKDGRTETKEKKTFFEDGNKIVIETKTKTEDGEEKIEVKRKITSPNGTEITFKSKTEIKDGRNRTTNSIQVKGVEAITKISIREETRGNITLLKAKLSTGTEQDIIVQPDEALQTALNEIGSTNNITFEITEFVKGNVRKAVFSAKAKKPGKFLGIFNTQIDLETLIDTETGKIIKTNRPWWAFLVVGQDKADICHIPEDNLNKRITISIAIPAVKAHLAHGDSIGKCMAECGDGILFENSEICETGINETRSCIIDGYSGTETCNSNCNGYDACITTESCGDSVINGLEECDDGNTLDGDGCSLCKIEII